jgi:hypothetical protein
VAVLLFMAVALTACAAPVATPTPPASVATSPPATVAASTSSAAPATARPSGGAVPVDPALLAHVPGQVDGLDVQPSPDSDAIATSDAIVVGNAEAVVTALVIDAPGGQFAHVTLVRLRHGVFDDAFFRRWRDAFDASVCNPMGGVAGHAEATLGGRRTFIGSCQAAVRTYHVWLPSSGVIVSVTSVGERRLGEKVVTALTD